MTLGDRFSALPQDAGGDRASTRVMVFTPSGVFDGSFRHAPGDRLSDAVRLSEGFILLTDVHIQLTADVELVSDRTPFLLINTAHIDVILPVEQSELARKHEAG